MLLDEELRSAEDDCNAALRYSPDNPAYLDSLGWVHLRLGEFSESIRDFNAALKRIPKQDSSLYGRGIAELRLNKRGSW